MSENIKTLVDTIDSSLQTARLVAMQLQNYVLETEGDSDLYRKLAYYLSPTLNHWLEGAQAGNIKDLRELLARRAASQGTTMQNPGQQGAGHEVLTKPSA